VSPRTPYTISLPHGELVVHRNCAHFILYAKLLAVTSL
jgi:hypothetical protein